MKLDALLEADGVDPAKIAEQINKRDGAIGDPPPDRPQKPLTDPKPPEDPKPRMIKRTYPIQRLSALPC